MFSSKRVILFFFLVSFAISGRAYAYSIDTHAYLTDEVINFYNKSFSNSPLSEEFRSYLIDGSRREDDIPRWMNHFYDPVNNKGLNDAFLGEWEKSKDWANDSGNQNSLKYKVPAVIASVLSAVEKGKISEISSETDFTWRRAIEYYANGENEKAFFLLGHIIHLIEDASVPDHTRNDPHPGDSPYENWTEQFNLQNKDAGLPTMLAGKNPILLDNLNSYFDGLANYSNNNFYSRDTIGVENYKSPVLDYVKKLGGYYYAFKEDVDTRDYPLFVYKTYSTGLIFSNNNAVTIQLTDEDEVVRSYWSRLSAKAVQYGAGVINLFFKEAEAAKNNPDFSKKSERKSLIASLASGAQSVMSVITGAAQKAAGALESILKQNNAPADKSADAAENINESVTEENAIPDTESPPESSELSEADKAALQGLQNRLDDLMRQASELKNKMEVAGSINRTDENQTPESKITSNNFQTSNNSQIGSVYNFVGSGGSSGGGGNVSPSSVAPIFFITEIFYNASGTDANREWIEIRNDGTSAAAPENIKFAEGGTNHSLAFARGSASLAAGAYAVIADDASQFFLDYPSFSGNLFDSSFSLSNDGEMLSLVFGGNVFHSVSYSSSTGANGDGNSLQLIGAAWRASVPTPGAANAWASSPMATSTEPVATSTSSGASAATSTSATATSTTTTATSTASGASHLVIGEVQVSGADAGDEFIELYNPTASAVDISEWSLQYVGGASVISSSTVAKKNFTATSSIAASGFFLVARGLNSSSTDGYRGAAVPNMTQRTFSLSGAAAGGKIFLVGNQELIESGADADIVDALDYALAAPADGQSLERRARRDGACVSALPGAAGEFLGNGCDTDDAGDFEIRSGPMPQNSLSLPESRTPPTIATSSLIFSSSSMSLIFNWSEAADANGATSSVVYEIREITSSTATSSLAMRATGAVHFSKGVDGEVGRDFNFTLQAVDKDGLSSAATSLAINVPSFFDKFYFYADPRASSTNKVIDAYYLGYPFVPGSAITWKMVLFYVNADALKNANLIEENRFAPSDASHLLSLSYKRCSGGGYPVPDNFLLLPEGDHCSIFGGGLYPQGIVGLEDMHFILPVTAAADIGSFTASTYITMAFYDWESRYGPYAGFGLVAVDKNRYYFRETAPSSTPPFAPGDLTLQFDDLHSILNLSWLAATDPDSSDGVLTYEINYSTSTEAGFSASTWQSVEKNLTGGVPAIFGNSYKVGMRAVDDFGNVSLLTERNWNFPSGFAPLPNQSDSSQHFGYSNGAGQRFLVSSSTAISRVAMIMGNGGAGSKTKVILGIYSDTGGAKGELIATSAFIEEDWPQETVRSKRGHMFNFPQPVVLTGGSYYWLVPMTIDYGLSSIYGSDSDTYPDGYWSGGPAADAYFFMR